jgi:hypothetical protein
VPGATNAPTGTYRVPDSGATGTTLPGTTSPGTPTPGTTGTGTTGTTGTGTPGSGSMTGSGTGR